MLTKMKSEPESMKLKWSGIAVFWAMAMYASGSWAFSIDDVAKQAKSLSEKSFEAPKSNLPAQFRDMKFADYQKIHFKHDKAYWSDLKTPFKLEFYHQGMYFDTPVKINEVTATRVREIAYKPENFTFDNIKHDPDTVKKLGYAGFKILYPLNNKNKDDEITSFLGASYFRIIGEGQVYGLSARGLAIDTALPSGEEFPVFKEFWIEQPKPQDKHLVIYALLDSPRATGAYRFIVRPGRDTKVDVDSKIYLRDNIGKIGISPLTSMFLFGPNQPSPRANYRPAMHDSNGLSIHSGNGEWVWRPLNNPRHLSVSTFKIENPRGFGLFQRGREFSRFQDLDEQYEKRPTGWIEPKGDWGKGQIELVEIPTADETNDNIVTFWSPEKLPEPGKAFDFQYRLHFTRDEDKLHDKDIAWVKETLRSAGDIKQINLARQPDGSTTFLVDFVGEEMSRLPADTALKSQVSVGDNGEVIEQRVRYNPETKGWRLILRLKVKDTKQPTEMRAALINGEKALTETWSYQLPANE